MISTSETPNSKPAGATGLDFVPAVSGGPVQRGSSPVQRGEVTTPPVDPSGGGIVAITQNAPVRVSVQVNLPKATALRAAKTAPTPRRILRTFKHRFALLVETGKKFQTVRPIPKREQDMPRVGDLFDAREWTGLPRRSKMRKLLPEPARISSVKPISISSPDGRLLYIVTDGFQLDGELTELFAKADGFTDAAEMAAWFQAQHGLPFEGIVIDWLPF